MYSSIKSCRQAFHQGKPKVCLLFFFYSIRIQLPYLPPLLPLLLLLVLPFSRRFWGVVFLFFFLFCHPYHSVVFPLSFDDDHDILPTRPHSAFLSVFLFLFLCRVVVPDDVFHQDLPRKASKQTAIRNHCLLDWLVGWFLFPFLFKLMKAEREGGEGGRGGSTQIFVLVMHTYQDRGAIDRSIDILPLPLLRHAPGL